MKWHIALTLCMSCSASAHSLSTAFMRVQNTPQGFTATLELGIADLQQALNWPVEQDLRWGDVQAHKTQIVSYLQQHMYLIDASDSRCSLETQASEWIAVKKDQRYYLSMPLFSTCDTQQSTLNYQLFNELHDHKLLVSWKQQQLVLSKRIPQLDLTKLAP